MNAKELSLILKKVSDILSLYNDKPIEYVLDDINKILKNEKKENALKRVENYNETDIEITEGLIQSLEKMNSEELAKYLQKDSKFKNKKSLLKLAKALSITTSSRNSLITLSHSIVKYFERQKMDKFIREDRNTQLIEDENSYKKNEN